MRAFYERYFHATKLIWVEFSELGLLIRWVIFSLKVDRISVQVSVSVGSVVASFRFDRISWVFFGAKWNSWRLCTYEFGSTAVCLLCCFQHPSNVERRTSNWDWTCSIRGTPEVEISCCRQCTMLLSWNNPVPTCSNIVRSRLFHFREHRIFPIDISRVAFAVTRTGNRKLK